MPSPLPAPLAGRIDERIDLLLDDAAPVPRASLARLLLASDYAFERLRRDRRLLDGIVRGELPVLPDALGTDRAALDALRRYRHAHSVAIAWDDIVGDAPVERTLAATSALAERCIAAALAAAEAAVAARHGRVRDGDGRPLRLVVFALGKLGGGELNFSSDVDLVFGYRGDGVSDGERPLEASEYFVRVGRQLIALLADATAEGFAYRVDMRLRPFGNAGRLALSFAAMEQYFQREGRDWERYAWIKARPVAGDIDAGEEFLETLRPFVYRRYLDYTAFDGLREMKGLIAAEVQRRDLAEHVKLGPGGIREIEFVVQLLQMIRGGREPELRSRALLPALAALGERGHLSEAAVQRLAAAYRFLRRVENRLQMRREEQTHEPPEDPQQRLRIALGLGFDDWDALAGELARHRALVSVEFERVFEAPKPQAPDLAAFAGYWSHVDAAGAAARLAETGIGDAEAVHARVREFADSPAVATLSARARRRLDRVLPALLATTATMEAPLPVVERAIRLLHAILRRSSYLALLAEQPAALTRVVEVMGASAWLAERVTAHPLLLDDLLDTRSEQPAADRAALFAERDLALQAIDAGDAEEVLHALNELRQSQTFRIALARLFGGDPPPATARRLAWLATAIVERLLPTALADLVRNHGALPGMDADGSVGIVAYGSFGGRELGFGSDLDLVFLYDGALLERESGGPRPLDAPRWYARLMQRFVNLLGTLTPAGRLFEVDLRLRPDGARGLLVSTLGSWADYQRERAWTWEHMALVRARVVAGSAALRERIEAVRHEVLGRERDAEQLREDVLRMRAKMRSELDRSRGGLFDLKQGRGGLVDLEFLLQGLVLQHASGHPALTASTETALLIGILRDAGLLGDEEAGRLTRAHATLLDRGLSCTLGGRPRLLQPDDAVESARRAIVAACAAHGYAFDGAGGDA